MQVLLEVPLVFSILDGQLALLVVGLDEVFNDSTGLPESEVSVGVDDSRYSTIGVDLGVLLGLGIVDLDLKTLYISAKFKYEEERRVLPSRKEFQAPRGQSIL